MALILYVYLLKEISDKAKICPNCGAPIQKEEFHKELSAAKKVAIAIIIVLTIVIIYYFIKGYWIPAHTYYVNENGQYVEEFRPFN